MRREEVRARLAAFSRAVRGAAEREPARRALAELRRRREQLVWAALALGVLLMVLHWR